MSTVHGSPLGPMDLNLVVLLDALLNEGSVTRAARRVGVTQSAASHGLRRLREALGDPLLVKSGRGLVPTPRALALRGPVRSALALLDEALAPPSFDPATARARFVILAADYVGVLLLPALVQRIAREAPGVTIAVRAPVADAAAALAEDADLSIGTAGGDAEGLYERVLFEDGFATALRADHPDRDRPWDLDLFCRLGHVLISPRGQSGSTVDPLLSAIGRERRVALEVAHFVSAAHVVAGSDLVVTLPERLGRHLAPSLGLALRPPPLPVPGFRISAQWHGRRHADPAHRWLRARVAEVAGAAASGP